MPAAVYVGDGRMAVQDLPVPVPGPDEVLVEVAQCGICGSDMHLVLEGYARAGTVLGHEWAGTVVAAGAAVSGWEPGARVVSNPTAGCGTCRPCRRGRPSVCLSREAPDYLSFGGAFCRYLAVRAEQLLRLPDTLSTRAAALTEPTAIAVHTVNLSQVTSDDRVLVTGAGPVGLLTVAVLLARGVTDITVSEPSAARRARAAAVGAAAVDRTRPIPGPRHSVDRSTRPSPWPSSARATPARPRPRSTSSTSPAPSSSSAPDVTCPRINHNRMIVLELTILGAYNYDADGFRPALELLASGAPAHRPPHRTRRRAPERRRRGHGSDWPTGEIAGKVLVRPQETS